MASSQDNVSMALFCDFENVALGVRDANYEQFDIKPILERLLLKGSIVIKKAYCDWDRYKGFKKPMHEANFELIEIPHVRQSGKNSADIRLVVDALDLCYTKSHVNTFVIISGDSDFSPLVSKLRENNKQVIGVGVKQSTSDLLVANCDEFIFYDDLVRENQRRAAKRSSGTRDAQPASNRSPEEERRRKDDVESRRRKAIELAVETFDALVLERGDGGKMWASVLKEAIKRRKPDFNESYYGFRAFGNLLEEAQARGLLEFGRDEKSGTYVYRGTGSLADAEPAGAQEGESAMEAAAAIANGRRETREPREPREGREGREGRKRGGRKSSRSREDGAVAGGDEASNASADATGSDEVSGASSDARDADAAWPTETDLPSHDNARDDDAAGNDDARWPDARDESPMAPWDELPMRSAGSPPANPFGSSSDDRVDDDADDDRRDRDQDATRGDTDAGASSTAGASAAPRKPSLMPARKRARDGKGRNRDRDVKGDARESRGASPDAGAARASNGGADAGATAQMSATRAQDADQPFAGVKEAAPAPFIGNATLLPVDAQMPRPSKAVVTRAPRRRGAGAAAEQGDAAGTAATASSAAAPASAATASTLTSASETSAKPSASATPAKSATAAAPAGTTEAPATGSGARRARKTAASMADAPTAATKQAARAARGNDDASSSDVASDTKPAARKAATRSRRPRKTASTPDAG